MKFVICCALFPRKRVMNEIVYIDPGELLPHEDVDPAAVQRVLADMKSSGVFATPLLVDRSTKVVLDGHHRLWASRELGCKRIPCYCVDYLEDDSIELESWRPDVKLSKQMVIETGLAGRTFPLKTTRHIYQLPDSDPVPLEKLLD
jgi:ParB-like chromosome segregation protein Spo0J